MKEVGTQDQGDARPRGMFGTQVSATKSENGSRLKEEVEEIQKEIEEKPPWMQKIDLGIHHSDLVHLETFIFSSEVVVQ